jgi:hypothetical protein
MFGALPSYVGHVPATGPRSCGVRLSWYFRVCGGPRPRSAQRSLTSGQNDRVERRDPAEFKATYVGAMPAYALRAQGDILAMKRQTVVLRRRAETMFSKNAPLRTSALPTTSNGVRLTPVTASAKGAAEFVGVVTAVVGVVVATVAVV